MHETVEMAAMVLDAVMGLSLVLFVIAYLQSGREQRRFLQAARNPKRRFQTWDGRIMNEVDWEHYARTLAHHQATWPVHYIGGVPIEGEVDPQ